MSYDISLANRVRAYLAEVPDLQIEEKAMFGGLAFLVNEKMCVNVSGENLMCRFDPEQEEEVCEREGYLYMKMSGRKMKGYCYVTAEGYVRPDDFAWWMDLCLEFNPKAKASGKK